MGLALHRASVLPTELKHCRGPERRACRLGDDSWTLTSFSRLHAKVHYVPEDVEKYKRQVK